MPRVAKKKETQKPKKIEKTEKTTSKRLSNAAATPLPGALAKKLSRMTDSFEQSTSGGWKPPVGEQFECQFIGLTAGKTKRDQDFASISYRIVGEGEHKGKEFSQYLNLTDYKGFCPGFKDAHEVALAMEGEDFEDFPAIYEFLTELVTEEACCIIESSKHNYTDGKGNEGTRINIKVVERIEYEGDDEEESGDDAEEGPDY